MLKEQKFTSLKKLSFSLSKLGPGSSANKRAPKMIKKRALIFVHRESPEDTLFLVVSALSFRRSDLVLQVFITLKILTLKVTIEKVAFNNKSSK